MQGSKLYVGNLSYSVTKEKVEELFSKHGAVTQVNIIEGKGFGFVEMANPADTQKAKEALNGTDFEGRTLKVDEARPPKSKDWQNRDGGQSRNRGGWQGGGDRGGWQGGDRGQGRDRDRGGRRRY
ncbi:MAG: RNA-binding protein [Candidatus Firestonebacteria bacterium]